MATIEDVAKLANVSTATVSRVLNNNPNVSLKTKLVVERVIKQLDYKPNMLGRNLRKAESMMILVLLPNISNPFYAKIIEGIEDTANRFGYTILLCGTNSDVKRQRNYLNMLRHKLVDGAIILDPTIDKKILEEVIGYPLIQCCEFDKTLGIPYVAIDNRAAACKAINYLIALGHEKIAFINNDSKFLYARDRYKGYINALEINNIKPRKEYIVTTSLDVYDGMKATKRLLQLNDPPTAIFTVSDTIAMGVIKVAKEMGKNIPKDLAIVGFDNIELSSVVSPTLTTISQPMYKMGELAFKLFIKSKTGNEIFEKENILGYELIVRETT